MAGILKPTGATIEGKWLVNEAVSTNTGGMTSLFNGARGAWNSENVFYFSNTTHFIDISLHQKSRMWAIGNVGYLSYNKPLKVEKWSGSSWVFVGNTSTRASTDTWDEMIVLDKGRYKFSFVEAYRMDDEWYIEDLTPRKILFLGDDGNVKTFTSLITSDETAIPKMTSNSAPSGRVFYESQYSAYQSWYAFDGASNPHGYLSNGKTGYIGYEFPTSKIISKYSIKSPTTSNLIRMPKNWTFEGSDDEKTWTVLDTQVGQIWSTVNLYNIYEFTNNKPFKMYRIKWTDNNGESLFTSVDEFQMFEVKSLQSIKIVPSQSEQLFINHGVSQSDLASIDLSSEFTGKHYIQDISTVLGEGKVFEQVLDTRKTTKKIRVK